MFSSECCFISRINSCKAEFYDNFTFPFIGLISTMTADTVGCRLLTHELMDALYACASMLIELCVTLANSLLLHSNFMLYFIFPNICSMFYHLIWSFVLPLSRCDEFENVRWTMLQWYRYETYVGPNINTPYAIKFILFSLLLIAVVPAVFRFLSLFVHKPKNQIKMNKNKCTICIYPQST